MIVEKRLVTYINSLDTGNTKVLDEIEREALDSYVPIIRKEMQSFLKLLLAMNRPKRILEVGTAVGFSSILMAEYAPKDCKIVTIENYEKRIPMLQDGDIIESHYAVTRRNRTIYKRMREYLYELTHREDLVTAVLPVGDGITVSTKVEENNSVEEERQDKDERD